MHLTRVVQNVDLFEREFSRHGYDAIRLQYRTMRCSVLSLFVMMFRNEFSYDVDDMMILLFSECRKTMQTYFAPS